MIKPPTRKELDSETQGYLEQKGKKKTMSRLTNDNIPRDSALFFASGEGVYFQCPLTLLSYEINFYQDEKCRSFFALVLKSEWRTVQAEAEREMMRSEGKRDGKYGQAEKDLSNAMKQMRLITDWADQKEGQP